MYVVQFAESVENCIAYWLMLSCYFVILYSINMLFTVAAIHASAVSVQNDDFFVLIACTALC